MAKLSDVKLSSEDILKKTFKTKVKGYDPDEVDTYLDQIISDYGVFRQIIEDLYGQIGDLQGKLIEAQKSSKAVAAKPSLEKDTEEIKTYTPVNKRPHISKNSFEDSISLGETSTNMAIIQRISILERKVYNLEQRVYGLQKQ